MPRRVLYPLIVAFVLAITCFLTSTWYAGSVTARISDATRSIATNAIPSIVHLTTARGELRRLDLAAGRFEQSRADLARTELVAARDSVDTAFDGYLGITVGVGERAPLQSVQQGLAQVDDAVGGLLAGTSAGTSAEVARAVDAAAAAIRGAIVFEADQAGTLASTIDADRSRALAIAWVLDVLSALMTAIVAYVAIRGLMLHQRALDANRRLLAQRADELEQFASRVAHDVVSPLAVTRLGLESAVSEVTGPLERRLMRAQRGLDRVVSIVDGLLEFARAGARPEPGAVTDVTKVAAEIVDELRPLASASSIALSLIAAPECYVNANEGVVASVVENLARNALKYGGSREAARVEVRVRGGAQTVRLEVEDNGPGIPPEIRETIWDPHVRGPARGQPGLGLGLATVKRVVDAHGGRCGVTSVTIAGSLFWCELPRATAPRLPQVIDLQGAGSRGTWRS